MCGIIMWVLDLLQIHNLERGARHSWGKSGYAAFSPDGTYRCQCIGFIKTRSGLQSSQSDGRGALSAYGQFGLLGFMRLFPPGGGGSG